MVRYYVKALRVRAYQAYLNEIKNPQSDAAAAFSDGYKYIMKYEVTDRLY